MTDPVSEVCKFGEQLRRQFATEFDSDPPGFKDRAMRALSSALPLKRGRPAETNITLAADLRAQDKEWKEIYPQCIPAHETLSREAQRIAEENLRAAVRSRRNAQRRRKPALDSFAK